MIMTSIRFWAVLVALVLLGLAAGVAAGTDAQPNSDERCLSQCDEKSDKCMQAAGGDEQKQKACDDKYEECLSSCR